MRGSRGSSSNGYLMLIYLSALLLSGVLAGCASPNSALIEPQPPLPKALIWSHPYPNLTIIVEYVEGFEPSEAALQEMLVTLEDVTDKQAIILAEPTVIPNHTNNPSRVWSKEELRAIDRKYDQEYGRGRADTAFLFVTYLDGILDDDPSDPAWSRGVQIRNSLFLFHGGVRANYAEGFVPRLGAENMERSTLIHELGHALGLVNCGIPMLTERENPNSRCHSTEDESVMRAGIEDWKADADAATGRENTLAPLHFSAADLRDLQAFRESGREQTAHVPRS